MPASTILAIDPGTWLSGWVLYDREQILGCGKDPNTDMLDIIECGGFDFVAIEMITSYGTFQGKDVHETCVWIGRFMLQLEQKFPEVPVVRITRTDVRNWHVGKSKGAAMDTLVSRALREKYGEKGTKKNPGFFYGVSKDAWQAFALAAYVDEYEREKRNNPNPKFRNESFVIDKVWTHEPPVKKPKKGRKTKDEELTVRLAGPAS